ncbi:MAG: alpha-1,4-glucan--maltose-1-phosphate maltosyltransferase [Verrucomicrobiales bacterium]|nr:alpha-1,4-glucan--maltose-1-phosphate maltosyltransferase [Verrucomicrobiales bacterium]
MGSTASSALSARPDSVFISNLSPVVQCGRYPTKRVIGESVVVEADIFKDGHDIIVAVAGWRKAGKRKWHEIPMHQLENDRWSVSLDFSEIGNYEITVTAWGDDFLTWIHDYERRLTGDQEDFSTEIEEGRVILNQTAIRATTAKAREDAEVIEELTSKLMKTASSDVPALMEDPDVLTLLARWPDRSIAATFAEPIQLVVETKLSSFSAWYEFFPRSAEGIEGKHSTLRDCLPRIEDAKEMGFDIVYFPPIHPIGVSHRKGKNNTVTCESDDVGSPWAIGAKEGGHREVHPDLGTISDLAWLVSEARDRGIEVALDFAIQCSPDHPYVSEHPEWFFHRPDGSIKYAENPPKKYQDIYPINFHCDDWQELWTELRDIVLFWMKQGVRVFRVDNPHTKPVSFWEWLIAEVHAVDPTIIFLSEAFTRPKLMQTLAKAGFTQSYTYFTWRHTKEELTEYVTELTKGHMRDYYRANFWPNTPDILDYDLQNALPSAFKMRAALAATLSSSWGIYSGYELIENAPLPGREEYLDSEKYQLKTRDWNAPGNIKSFLTRLNQARNQCPALQSYANIEFIPADNCNILAYRKWSDDGKNHIITIVNLDPLNRHESNIHLPLEAMGLSQSKSFFVDDVIYEETYEWRESTNFVALDPRTKPVHIFQVRTS